MKKLIFIMLIFSFFIAYSQDELTIGDANFEKNNKYNFSLGSGIQFSFDNDRHVFGIGGMIQSRYLHENPLNLSSEPLNYLG